MRKDTRKLDLSALSRRAKLRHGAKLEIRATNPGTIGIVVTDTVRANKRPTQSGRCLPPGAARPLACVV